MTGAACGVAPAGCVTCPAPDGLAVCLPGGLFGTNVGPGLKVGGPAGFLMGSWVRMSIRCESRRSATGCCASSSLTWKRSAVHLPSMRGGKVGGWCAACRKAVLVKGSPRVRRFNFLQLLSGAVGRWRGEVCEKHTDSGPDLNGRGVELRRVDRGLVRDAREARDPCRIGDGTTPPPETSLGVPGAALLTPLVIATAVAGSAAAGT